MQSFASPWGGSGVSHSLIGLLSRVSQPTLFMRTRLTKSNDFHFAGPQLNRPSFRSGLTIVSRAIDRKIPGLGIDRYSEECIKGKPVSLKKFFSVIFLMPGQL